MSKEIKKPVPAPEPKKPIEIPRAGETIIKGNVPKMENPPPPPKDKK